MRALSSALIDYGQRKYALILFFALLLLSACAVQPPVPVPDYPTQQQWQIHQNALTGLTLWTLSGRMSVQMENEGWSASLHWQQINDDYRLRIIAPFGRGTVEISGNSDTVRLQTAENQIFEDADVELLIRQNLGWEIPVAALVYWIKGLPEPDTDITTLIIDNQGRASDLIQAGWTIKYERYTTSSGLQVPTRITLQREGLQLRLNISRWDIPT